MNVDSVTKTKKNTSLVPAGYEFRTWRFGGDRRASRLKFVTRFFGTTIGLSVFVTYVGEYRWASIIIIIILFITFFPFSRAHDPRTLDDRAKNPTLIVRKKLARIFRFIYFFFYFFPVDVKLESRVNTHAY